ncbi:6-phosphogluconolactonase [Campylobacter sp. RM9929]|uniref:6-phosphogluconolactonase n=1 Tax=Campylobacter molothri TaxID=1032242 RepID=UPI001DF71E05|nr:6-phosphogluconolactonase [Campylobacter sp. W0067]MBZ7938091.1 6-phosphogluconolactonase [Campylobacter sp. RM10538]MBZ7948706.1 6-phosphogluconolactonase [Campylobacter sp. RM9929]MBZ7963364.1 6-phosphogluconolactonase [Campylobacter sp. W0049]MBZ7966455.1 6-phosphogluconolactonase [Campylobacter sp. RM10535]MBZ7967918.1 6-phosphogluconolactonase [Campylobacter sp. RM9756]
MAFKMHEFSDLESCNKALVEAVVLSIDQILSDKQSVNLAFSGGKSPVLFLEMLSKKACAWDKCNISLVDERIVELDHEDSNARLIKMHFLKNLAQKAHFKPFFKDCKLSLEDLVKNANKFYNQPDIAILGMGGDGHTASLFPEADEINFALTTQKNIVSVTPKNAPYKRLSMSLSALENCNELFLSIATREKQLVFNEATKGLNPKFPISYILHSKKVMCNVYFSK